MFLREIKYAMRIISVVNESFNTVNMGNLDLNFWFRKKPHCHIGSPCPSPFFLPRPAVWPWVRSQCAPSLVAGQLLQAQSKPCDSPSWLTGSSLPMAWFILSALFIWLRNTSNTARVSDVMVSFTSDELILDRQAGQQSSSQQFAFLLIFLSSLQYACTSATYDTIY